MKKILTTLIVLAILLNACRKGVDQSPPESINGEVSENNEALEPFPCHAVSFSTNYPTLPGKIPPFRFTKTQYASGRIKTINMLSRAHPNHPAFKPQAWEVIGAFTYNSTDAAYFKGTKQLWEYYKTSSGAAAKKSIIKKDVSLRFDFYTEDDYAAPIGYCGYVHNTATNKTALMLSYMFNLEISVQDGSDEGPQTFSVNAYGGDNETDPYKPIVISSGYHGETPYGPYGERKKIKFTYAAGKPLRSLSYQPTQNWISLEYTLLEVMNWLPPQYYINSERAGVSVEFYPYNTAYKVVQSQQYKNHKYDSKGNLLSYTYGDNVLQKTTWVCK